MTTDVFGLNLSYYATKMNTVYLKCLMNQINST